jgi:hypothetical protein
MIHAFDGREEWEVDVDWAGVDGRLDVSLWLITDYDITVSNLLAVPNACTTETCE